MILTLEKTASSHSFLSSSNDRRRIISKLSPIRIRTRRNKIVRKAEKILLGKKKENVKEIENDRIEEKLEICTSR